MINNKKSGDDSYELEKRIKSSTFDRDYLDVESNQTIKRFDKYFNEKEFHVSEGLMKPVESNSLVRVLRRYL